MRDFLSPSEKNRTSKEMEDKTTVIRIATDHDVSMIADTYIRLLKHEQEHGGYSNWQLGVYPTQAIAQEKTAARMMYLLERDGQICGSMILNNEQAPEYAAVEWKYLATHDEVLVIHTLCIPPDMAGKGYAAKMLDFAKSFAKEHGFKVIRIDTYAGNKPAINLYVKNGFSVAGYGDIVLQGLIQEPQVYLECLIK